VRLTKGRGLSGGARPQSAAADALVRSAPPATCGPFHAMPNIKQQKKRVRSAARERLENLRYRSTVKTLTRRLEAAVSEGDAERVASEHRELVRWIDRAAARGALHRNTAARRKALAARIAAGARS
jgi:small subunit ribosomal protein S20